LIAAGGPLGFAYSWRLTDNGAEGIARANSGTFLPLDELGQLNAEVAASLSYMLGNGLGKGRAGRNGETRPSAEWRTAFLSTGEVGIATKIEEAGRNRKAKAGSLVRLIDVPADAGKDFGLFEDCHGQPAADFAHSLKSNALSHYGWAGPEFVAYLARSTAYALGGHSGQWRRGGANSIEAHLFDCLCSAFCSKWPRWPRWPLKFFNAKGFRKEISSARETRSGPATSNFSRWAKSCSAIASCRHRCRSRWPLWPHWPPRLCWLTRADFRRDHIASSTI
jgi:hypothetical protein